MKYEKVTEIWVLIEGTTFDGVREYEEWFGDDEGNGQIIVTYDTIFRPHEYLKASFQTREEAVKEQIRLANDFYEKKDHYLWRSPSYDGDYCEVTDNEDSYWWRIQKFIAT